jgi:hypothetical protein
MGLCAHLCAGGRAVEPRSKRASSFLTIFMLQIIITIIVINSNISTISICSLFSPFGKNLLLRTDYIYVRFVGRSLKVEISGSHGRV